MKPTHQPSLAQMKLALAKGGNVEVRPTVKDETIQRKIPEMEEAAKAVSAGEMSHEDYDKVVNKHKPVKPYEFVPKPATDEDADRALMENKKPHWRGHEDWPAGRKVGLRLDIPAYENHGVWVNSIHDEEGKGEDKRNTSYGPVSSVKNATFDAGPSKGIKVATGEQNKSPFARIKGDLHHMSEDEAVAHMKKYLNHPDYVQVGMDPRRHGYFYDRKTMQPVTHAKHVVQIGPLVLAHKPTYGPRETYADGGKVKPSVAQMKLELNKQGMHSPLEKAAMAVPRPKGTPAEFMAEISKQPGFRKEEVADRKISLPEQKMTKEEFLAHLKKHPAPKLEEKVLGGNELFNALDDWARQYKGDEDATYEDLDFRERNLAKSEIDSDFGYNTDTKYEDYKLPGGENYREILLKLPSFSKSKERQIMELESNIRRMNPADYAPGYVQSMIDGVAKLKAEKAAMGDTYQSSHWGDDPNVLAHIRVSDRYAPNEDGPHNVKVIGGGGYSNKVFRNREEAEQFADVKHQGGYKTEITPTTKKKFLHVEEIQSDWHQEGRKKGYAKPETSRMPGNVVDVGDGTYRVEWPDGTFSGGYNWASAMEKAEQGKSNAKPGVPDAPFKKNWHELALKHVLGMAAKGGYHGVAITPGEEQASRYDLSKQIGSIAYNPEEKILDAWDHNRRQVMRREINDESQLADYIGKEAANKLLQTEPVMGKHLLEGQDLKVGGEGMKGFYDKIVPDYLNKLGKPHGVQVGKISSSGENPTDEQVRMHHGIGILRWNIKTPEEKEELKQQMNGGSTDLHYFPIPDSMRQQIKTEGLPQYQVGGIIHKAEGGNVQPSTAEMRMALAKHNPIELQRIGVNEAPNMSPKAFFSPEQVSGIGVPPPGGVATPSGAAIGGVDVNRQQPGQQLMAQPQQPQGGLPGQPGQPPQGGMAPPAPSAAPAGPTPPGGGNILQMTPQGRAMSALGGSLAPGMAKGGSAKSVEDMKAELAAKAKAKAAPQASDDDDEEEEEKAPSKRILVKAEGPGGVTGIVIPHHMLHGRSWINKKGKKVVVPGLKDINKSRAEVYGAENRDPLTIGQMGKIHKDTLAEHFNKPLKDQLAAEKEATSRLRAAKHLGAKNNTLDESEKLDTVRHETDEQGRTHVGFASKGVAGHALYTSGHGKNEKHHIINTCPGQTEGCGGGKDAEGVIDTSRGTCFAPGAESQYVHAAVRRACHEQAKHDPAMTRDWILAHTGSMREAAKKADKNNQRLLFRPNVVDETDVSSRHAIRHLNEQRKYDDKPPIIANSYGKTNELHDPENGYYVTHSNVGPKVKKGKEISENIGRDKARVRNTIMAADNKGDFKNEQGNLTPPKGSYMVTDVKRNSPMSKKMEEHITHAKYWSTGREEHELTPEEKAEGPEGHFNGSGRKTSEDKAHYGHTTLDGKRFDYQRQHIVHPRLVNVPIRKKNKETGEMETKDHMIPTDSRFKDTEFLPEKRFKTKNGKDAGHILMTTPTESTSNLGHQTSFTHHVNDSHIEHAKKNNGEYEIDKPEDQLKATGKEYAAPQPVKFYAEGGNVGYTGRHPAMSHDDFHAFPEQNGMAQRHLTMRLGDDEAKGKYHSNKKAVVLHKNMDTIRLEMTKKAK